MNLHEKFILIIIKNDLLSISGIAFN